MALDPYTSGAGMAIGTGLSIAGLLTHEDTKIPPFTPINLTNSQANTIAGNLGNANAAEALASRTTMFNTEQIKKMLVAMDPNYAALSEGVGKNILAGLRGEISPEDTGILMNRAAAKAVGGGYSGSGMERNLKARDLGLTQYQITQNAISSAERWMAQVANTASPGFMSSASMFMSPAQRAQLDVAQNEFGWQANVMAAKQDAANANYLSDWLQSTGGALMGGGMMGLAGSGIGSGGGGKTPLQISTTFPGYGVYEQPKF